MFPALGKKVDVRFGDLAFRLDFTSENQMTFTGLVAPYLGQSETVTYTAVEIRPDVYMVYWKEKDGTAVVHVEDFGKGIVHTNIARPDGNFWNLSGSLTFAA
ncbi:MAG: hypothetical protein ORN49_06350 [Rhodobacteraceae bacterium]|nr:hypothetical protein [Paracoccaceae bacterium]